LRIKVTQPRSFFALDRAERPNWKAKRQRRPLLPSVILAKKSWVFRPLFRPETALRGNAGAAVCAAAKHIYIQQIKVVHSRLAEGRFSHRNAQDRDRTRPAFEFN
jgi:hypothetical protein